MKCTTFIIRQEIFRRKMKISGREGVDSCHYSFVFVQLINKAYTPSQLDHMAALEAESS
jgi:hypothetical protein